MNYKNNFPTNLTAKRKDIWQFFLPDIHTIQIELQEHKHTFQKKSASCNGICDNFKFPHEIFSMIIIKKMINSIKPNFAGCNY